MSFSLATLWHDRQRFLPGVLAVAFSAVLIALQCGLLLGLLAVTSIPIDHTRADVWVGAANVLSVDIGGPIPTAWLSRMNHPEIVRCEEYVQGFTKWKKAAGGEELCIVIGSRLESDSLGALDALTPELRERLTEPNAIVVDEGELDRLGVAGVGDYGEILGRRMRVVGLIRGYKSLAGPYVFCSLGTARLLLRLNPDQTTYLLGKCRDPLQAPEVVERLRTYEKDMSAFTAAEFSVRSRVHWLTKTKAGVALGYSALLGLLVGAVVTSQTLYAAVAASLREYAILQALGIPRWRMAGAVMAQSFWVGVIGVAVALPTVYGLARLAEMAGARVDLSALLLGAVTAITLVMALASGLAALRSLRLIEPASLLR